MKWEIKKKKKPNLIIRKPMYNSQGIKLTTDAAENQITKRQET